MPLLTNHVWVVGAQWMKHLLLLNYLWFGYYKFSRVILLINTVKLE